MEVEPRKVFLGSIYATIEKPELVDILNSYELFPEHVYMLSNKPGVGNDSVRCAFVLFETEDEAQECLALHDTEDERLTRSRVVASIIVTQHGSSFSF